MNQIPMLNQEEIEKLSESVVVIYGYNQDAMRIYHALKRLEIDVLGVYTAGEFIRSVGALVEGIPLVTRRKLVRQQKTGVKLLIQPSAEKYVAKIKVAAEISQIQPGVLLHTVATAQVCQSLRACPKIDSEAQWEDKRFSRKIRAALIAHISRKPKYPVVICNPTKTADFTLNFTFDRANGNPKKKVLALMSRGNVTLFQRTNNQFLFKGFNAISKLFDNGSKKIDYVNLFHRTYLVNPSQYKAAETVKIITAVREPISQNLSIFYQGISNPVLFREKWFIGALEGLSREQQQEKLEQLHNYFISNEQDADALFNGYIERYIYSDVQRRDVDFSTPEFVSTYTHHIIQAFIPMFNQYVVNLFAHPFDQEAGYSILKEGNIEIFVYQLEKLNRVVPHLSAWLGVSFDKLENGNVGEGKWIGDSYKQAQKEIAITQEYFDRCFDEPYVKHFYSEADIEKFKAKWRGHIK